MDKLWRNIVMCLLIAVLFVMPISADIGNIELKNGGFGISNPYVKTTYMVPMRDGVHLATDVYLPYEDYPPHGTILIRTVYNKDNIERYMRGQDYDLEEWVEKGWPFVVQDERGTYASEGKESINPGGDYYDGYDTVKWVAAQPWCNGKIATWGRSAFGNNQYLLAGSNPPNLSCQYVGVATSNIYKDGCYPGGELRRYLLENRLEEKSFLRILEMENFSLDEWGEVTLIDKWENVNAPAIHIGGWYDMWTQGTLDAFMGYQYNGGEHGKGNSKLIMGPWAHTQFGYNKSKTGDIRFPSSQYDTFSRNMFEDMITYYTMDGPDEYSAYPTVSYYVMGDVDDSNATVNEWRYSPVWPIPSTKTSYYFHENGLLSTTMPRNYAPLTYQYDPTNPVPTHGGNNLLLSQGSKDQASLEDRTDVLLFTSAVLQKPLEATGPITAKLFVSSDCPDTDFTVKLTDVYPDGRSMLVMDGILRMRNRNGNDHWDFMDAGEIYEITIDLWSTSYVWNMGHQIRVAISSSNSPRFLANPNTVDGIYKNTTYSIAKNTLYMDSSHPSCIILPVIEEKTFINTPKTGYLYIGGREILPLPLKNTIILGNINIAINTDMEYGIEKVEFYIDDEIKITDDESPYEWLWDETKFGKHTIKTVAYARSGKTIERNLQVLIFNF
jgi:predicted acyl esterase